MQSIIVAADVIRRLGRRTADRSIRRSGQPTRATASRMQAFLAGTWSAEGIMASGHVNRI